MPIPTPDSREADLAALYERLGPRLFRYAAAILASAQDAEEVVQEVFMAIAEMNPWPKDTDPYLFRAVRNASLKLLSRTQRRRKLLSEGAFQLVPREGADPGVGELAGAAAKALGDLPAEQRETVALHLFEGQTFEAIGELCGVPAATAASRYRYGIEKMREVLDERR